MRERLLQYHLQLGRLSAAAAGDHNGSLGSRVPLSVAGDDGAARRDRRGPRPPPQPAMTGNEPGGLPSVLRDRMENVGHADLIGSLLNPRGARVLEIRPRAGTILERLKRHDQADVQAMAIWQSQQFISGARPPRTPAGRPADAQ
jgi:hypothetical protein